MRKRILGTIIAAGLFAVAAFAGANGLAETQAACEHSQVKDGACVDCNDPVECIEVEDASGTAKGTYSKLEDAAAAAGNGDILKLLYNCESTSTYIDAGNKNLTIDLNKKELKAVHFDIMGSLVIENGEYSGYIRNAATGNEHTLTFENVRADLTQLGWYAKGGIKLVNSNIEQQHDGAAFTEWWIEKLQMDQTSVYKITNSPSGLSNYGLLSLDEAVGGIEEFLPAGYTLDGQPNSYNTILDETGTKARSVELRYRRLTDATVSVSIAPTSYVYDGKAKEPTVTVTYDGRDLTEGTDYTCTFTDNINAGTASVKITAKGKTYHGETVKNYTIDKAPQTAPTGLTTENESAKGKKDGSIKNVDVSMEYSVDQNVWKPITTNTITGISAGDYYVRYKETANYYASGATKVTVKMSVPDGGTTEDVTTEDVTTEASTDATTEDTTEATTTTEDRTDDTTEDVTTESTDDTQDETEDVTTESEEVVSTENQTTEKTDADKPDDQKNTGVKTGDDFAMKTAVAGMIISLGLAGIVVINKRRK